MNDLHLPPERDLPDPDAMFDRIVAAGAHDSAEEADMIPLDAERSSRRSRRWIPLSIAAAVGALAIGAGIYQGVSMRTRDAQPAGPSSVAATTWTPSPSSAPTSMKPSPTTTSGAPTSSAPGTSAPTSSKPSSTAPRSTSSTKPPASTANAGPQQFLGTGKATFPHLTVEFTDGPKNYPVPIELEFVAGFYMRTCVTSLPSEYVKAGAMPVSLAPFSAVMGTSQKENTLTRLAPKDGHQPAYPASATLAPGKCVEGFVSFDFGEFVDAPSDYTDLIYANSLGDRAVWNNH